MKEYGAQLGFKLRAFLYYAKKFELNGSILIGNGKLYGNQNPCVRPRKTEPKCILRPLCQVLGTWRGPDSLSESAKQKGARKVLLFALVSHYPNMSNTLMGFTNNTSGTL